MFGIGRTVGDAHRKPRQDCRNQIEPRVQRFGKNTKAPGRDSEKHFEPHQDKRRADRPERRHLLDRTGRACDGRSSKRLYDGAMWKAPGMLMRNHAISHVNYLMWTLALLAFCDE